MTLSMSQARALIQPTDGGVHNQKKQFDTQDIISLVLAKDREAGAQLAEFSVGIPATKEGLRAIYDFLVRQIDYVKDPKGSQWVRSPANLIGERKGDCKSYSLFTAGILQNLGLEYYYDLTKYSRRHKNPKHIYVTAILPNGEEVIVDAVWGTFGGDFNTEKAYVGDKIRYKMSKQGLAYLTGIGDANDGADTNTVVEAIAEINAQIPDSILRNDVTEMTEGELQRFTTASKLKSAANKAGSIEEARRMRAVASAVQYGELAGLGDAGLEERDMTQVELFLEKTDKLTAPAFTAPTLRIAGADEEEETLNGSRRARRAARRSRRRKRRKEKGGFIKRIGRGIGKGVKTVVKGAGKVVKTVATAFAKAWKKVMNFFFKKLLPIMAPGLLFFRMAKKNLLKGKAKKSLKQQEKFVGWLVKRGIKRSTIEAGADAGIMKKFGKTADAVVEDEMKKGAKVGWVAAAATIISKVIAFIKQITGLFKKNDAPKVDEDLLSNPDMIDRETADKLLNEKATGSAGGGNAMLFGGLFAAAGIGYLLLPKGR